MQTETHLKPHIFCRISFAIPFDPILLDSVGVLLQKVIAFLNRKVYTAQKNILRNFNWR